MYNAINFDWTYDDPPNMTASEVYAPVPQLPERSGTGSLARRKGGNEGTMSYGNLEGDWYVWWHGGPQNRSAFSPNYSRRLAQFTDGLSNTMVFGETLRSAASQLRKCSSNGGMTPTSFPDTVAIPRVHPVAWLPCSRRQRKPTRNGPTARSSTTALTTALTPNTQVLLPGYPNPYDLVTNDENQGGCDLRRPDGRQLSPRRRQRLMADGSVRFVKRQHQRPSLAQPWARSPAAR